MQRIVIFDMDGTLIDSSRDITLSINHVRRHCYDLDPLSDQYVVDAINSAQRNLAQLFYNTQIYEEKARSLFEEHYHEQCIQNVLAYDGIHDTLASLHAHGCKMGVATNAPSQFAKRMLHHLGLASYFSHIVGADNVKNPKPHSEMLDIHLITHAYEPSRDQAWMVGDNTKDMDAASMANIHGIFAAWGFSDHGQGDYIAYSPMDISKIILED